MTDLNTTNGLSESWKHMVGLIDSNGTALTQEQFDKWLSDETRTFVCEACGTEMNEAQFCSRCRDYKYIVPLILGWSWGDE